MDLHCSVSEVAGATVLVVRGDLDLSTVPTLGDQLSRVIQRHAGAIVTIDLDEVTSIDDAAIGVLLGAAAGARRTGGDLRVVAGRRSIRQRLEAVRLDRLIDLGAAIHDDPSA